METIELSKAPLEPVACQLYAQQEQKSALWDVVNTLAEKDRDIMTMFYREGYSTKEIGEQMGITQNQVLVRLHRARQKLKEEFIMAHQTYAIGEMQPSFIEQIMNALPKQHIAPHQPIISLGLGKSVALVTAALVSLAIGFGSFLSNETTPPTTPGSEEAMGVFLFTASDQQLALSISALQTATEGKGHKLPAGQPGAVVWGRKRDIQGIVQIAEPVYHGGSLWATQAAPGGYENWVNTRTKIQLSFIEKQIPLSSKELFKQPLLLISGDKPVELNKAERANLRKYLVEKGGLLVVDEVPGEPGGFVSSIQKILKEILPDSQTTKVKNEEHTIYRIYYEMGGPPAGTKKVSKNYLEGAFLKGNLLALYSDRNYWLYLMEDSRDLTEEDRQQLRAQLEANKFSPDWAPQLIAGMGTKRFFCNLLIYAITRGNIANYSDYVP